MEGNIEDWRKAGRIANESLHYAKSLVKPGASLLEVSEKVEKKIFDLGGQPAFPAQFSMDEVAAHYCADPDEETIFEEQLVCIDIGVHVEGAIGDNALTVDLSEKYSELVKASEEALKNAIKIVQIGTTLGEIGKTVQETIESFGYRPIRNLSGHGLDLFNIHSSPSIPNFATKQEEALEKGMTIAIEPFASTGAGIIHELDKSNIFSFVHKKPVRSLITRQVLKEINKYQGLPFTTRWLIKKFPAVKVNFALRDLLQQGIIRQYPPLPDKDKGMVSQAEHSLLVDDKVEILTKFDG